MSRDLPAAIQPYLVSQWETEVNCVLDFDTVAELSIGSKSLEVHPFSDQRFFDLLPGFLEYEVASITLSASKSEFTHLDKEFLPEFDDIKAMRITPQEMHRFLQEAPKDKEYSFYIGHENGVLTIKRIDVHYDRTGWYFMCWDFDETPVLDYELVVHRKRNP